MSRQETENRAERRTDQRSGKRQDKADAQGEDQAAENVAAQFVGAQRMRPGAAETDPTMRPTCRFADSALCRIELIEDSPRWLQQDHSRGREPDTIAVSLKYRSFNLLLRSR